MSMTIHHSSKWDKLVETTWNENASDWKENSESRWQSGSRQEIMPFFKKHIQKSSQVLDVGCGPGYSTNLLHDMGYKAFGTDISPEMIRHAKETYAHIPFQVADVAQMKEIKDETMDAVLAINVLEWTETPIKALKELKRILKSDGYLCIGILGPTAGPRAYSYPRIYGKEVIQNTMMPWEFQRMAYENNLELVDHLFVWRKGVKEAHVASLQFSMQQALSFMTVFMLRKKGATNDNG